MIADFAGLPQEDIDQLTDAIPYITILIAGADGEIEPEELEWAEKITQVRQFDYPGLMNSYYTKVGENYNDRLSALLNELPGDTVRRKDAIEAKMAGLNPILAKLDTHYADLLIKSYRSFAKHVAKASGGIFGFGSVNDDEARVMGLKMLKAIEGKL